MLVAGVDISGKSGITNYTFMAIVLGTPEKINSIHRQLANSQDNFINFIDKNRRNKIIDKLQIDGKECIALCIKIDRDTILEDIKNKRRIRRSKITTRKLIQTYNILLLREIRNKIEEFLIKYNHTLIDLNFQCDGDCIGFVKDNGLSFTNRGNAYELADLVAWANNKNIEPKGTMPVDVVESLGVKLKNALL